MIVSFDNAEKFVMRKNDALRKNRYTSANVTPASPMDTWTADRTFALILT